MDKRKFNGGNKNAGRKPKSEEIKMVERLSPLEDDALAALTEGVQSKDINWVRLYLSYYLGKPRETKEITINEELPLFID